MKSRIRVFDGSVFLYIESGSGATQQYHWSLADVQYMDIPSEHWKQIDEWREQAAAIEEARGTLV